jgi:hypothetical protein
MRFIAGKSDRLAFHPEKARRLRIGGEENAELVFSGCSCRDASDGFAEEFVDGPIEFLAFGSAVQR